MTVLIPRGPQVTGVGEVKSPLCSVPIVDDVILNVVSPLGVRMLACKHFVHDVVNK